MSLAFRKTLDVQIDGEVYTLQKLSGSSLEKASTTRRIQAIREAAALGKEALQAFKEASAARSKDKPAEPTPEERRRARYALYDRDTSLLSGLQRWTLKDEKGRPESITENYTELEEPVAQQLFEKLIDFSLGPIDVAEAREAEGKDSGPSTGF